MSFKTEFQRYKKAVEDDIKELEIVIGWLEMTADANVSGVPKVEIAKLVSFYKGTKDSKQVEKKKIEELEWYIENNWKKLKKVLDKWFFLYYTKNIENWERNWKWKKLN